MIKKRNQDKTKNDGNAGENQEEPLNDTTIFKRLFFEMYHFHVQNALSAFARCSW